MRQRFPLLIRPWPWSVAAMWSRSFFQRFSWGRCETMTGLLDYFYGWWRSIRSNCVEMLGLMRVEAPDFSPGNRMISPMSALAPASPGRARERLFPQTIKRCVSLLVILLSLSFTAFAADKEHGTVVHQTTLYVLPGSNSGKVAQVERGRDLVVLEKTNIDNNQP